MHGATSATADAKTAAAKTVAIPLNYLDQTYQKSFVTALLVNITRELRSYAITRSKKIDAVQINKALNTFDALERQADAGKKFGNDIDHAKFQLAHTLHAEMQALEKKYHATIETKDTERNHKILSQFVADLKQLLIKGQQLMKKLEQQHGGVTLKGTLGGIFEKYINECEQHQDVLLHAMSPRIYQVTVPKTDYAEIKKAPTFLYEGRTTAALKTISGGLIAVAGTVALLTVSADGSAPIPAADNAILDTVDKSAKLASQATKRTGYALKRDIPPEWIEKEVKDDSAKPPLTNPNWKKPASPDDVVTMYIIDGRSPEDVFNHGTHYHLKENGVANPHGHTIIFSELGDARHCAAVRADGKQYDPIAGWRRNNDWTEAQRNEVHASVAGIPKTAAALSPAQLMTKQGFHTDPKPTDAKKPQGGAGPSKNVQPLPTPHK